MDHLWKHVKAEVLANQPTRSIDQSAEAACQYILDLSRRERLRKAGILSGRFWLAKGSPSLSVKRECALLESHWKREPTPFAALAVSEDQSSLAHSLAAEEL